MNASKLVKERKRRRVDTLESVEGANVTDIDMAQLHAELHALIMMPADDEAIREAFRKRTMEYVGAIGVAHLRRDDEGDWDLKPGHASGRVPRRHDFVEKFGQSCQATLQRNSIQIETFLGLQAIFAPVNITGSKPEVLLILTREFDASQTIHAVEVILEYFSLWIKERKSNDHAWKLVSLSALVELVSEVEQADDQTMAAQTIAQLLSQHLDCAHVAVGLMKRERLKLIGISGQSESQEDSRFSQRITTALSECLLRDDIGVWPSSESSGSHLMLAHQQLAREGSFESLVSCPLRTPSGELMGALLIGNKGQTRSSERMRNFVRAAAPRLASALHVVGRAEVGLFRKALRNVGQQLSTIRGRIWMGVVAVLLGVLCVPVPYRVRCDCVVDASSRRYAVAPFDGVVERSWGERGAMVKDGQLLARMDGRSLRYRLASIEADLARATKQRDIQLVGHDIPGSLLAGLEARSLTAERNLLRHQESQIEICSPTDGVILDGAVENTLGASVSKGDVLFEVGPIDELTIEINIPADEISHVSALQAVRVWIDGFESESFITEIQKITPQSELRNGRNVFVAEIRISNEDGRFRPGMKGYARIDTTPKTLAWNLFHKPVEFLVSRLAWW